MRAWINGDLLPDPTAPALGVTDHGFTVGDGVFEAIKVVDGRPFALTRHLARLGPAPLGRRARAPRGRRRRRTPGGGGRAGGPGAPPGPDPDHLHRGTRAARLRPR